MLHFCQDVIIGHHVMYVCMYVFVCVCVCVCVCTVCVCVLCVCTVCVCTVCVCVFYRVKGGFQGHLEFKGKLGLAYQDQR